jgi:hypothetical protein
MVIKVNIEGSARHALGLRHAENEDPASVVTEDFGLSSGGDGS